MKFNSYEVASKNLSEEFLEITDNVILPILTGQSLIHIRTHEEDRILGICDTFPDRISENFRVLHILSDSGVESSLLVDSEDAEEMKYAELNVAPQPGDEHQSIHIRALTSFLSNPDGGILLILGGDHVCRQNEFIRRLKNHANTSLLASESEVPKLIILHTISQDTPESLSRTIQSYDLPLPKDGTLHSSLMAVRQDLNLPKLNSEVSEQWVRALRGLTVIEAERSLFQTFTVHNNKCNEESLQYLQSVKRNIIKQTGLMEFHEPSTKFEDIGGLGHLVEDLVLRRDEFEIEARDAGIKSPKGCLLVGLPGTGKSLIAQSVAGEWQLPMLEFNMANVLDSYVGSSEQNIRKILAVAESMEPCVLMVDEIDKALSGLGSSGGDSGTTRRVIGSFLTWLNDRKADVYVIATANDLREIASAMPEMLRKGRWDDIWWVDLPDEETRKKILQIHLQKIPEHRIESEVWEQLTTLSSLNSGVTGAELAAAVNEANRISFHNDRLVDVNQLTQSITSIKPLAAGIRGLSDTRKWMKDFARPASPKKAAEVESTTDIYLAGLDASSQFIPADSETNEFRILRELLDSMAPKLDE